MAGLAVALAKQLWPRNIIGLAEYLSSEEKAAENIQYEEMIKLA